MNFNLHGYKYQVGDVAWILTSGLESRSGICVAVNGDNYDILMDDTHGVETFDHTELFPLKSYTEIKRQTLVSPTPTITPSSTPAVTRTPRPSSTPFPTPSVSATTRNNLLSTATATWTSTDGIATIIAADKIKFASNTAINYPVYAADPTLPTVGVAFTTSVTVQPHSDYAIAFDMDQGSCRFISVMVTRSGSSVPLFSQYYMDSTRLNLILNTYDSTSLTITVQLYDDANYATKARHGRYYIINRLNMGYIKYNNIALNIPTPTPGGVSYDALVASLNPLYYWSLKNGASATVGTNPLTLGITTTLSNGLLNITAPTGTPSDTDILGAKLATSVSLSTNYTLEAWINLPELTSYSNIIGTDDPNGTGLILNTDGTLSLYSNTDYYEISFGFTPNTDYHIVLTVDSGGKIVTFVNGAKFVVGDSNSSSNNSVDTYNYTYIGGDAIQEVCVGKIGDVAIYNKVLTDAEVLANYNAGTNGYKYTAHTVIAPLPPVYLPYSLSRLNSDGTIDGTYTDIHGNERINSALPYTNGIAIGGLFTGFNGSDRYGIFKLNNDGTLNSFNIPVNSTSNAAFYKAYKTVDGKTYICADATRSLYRLNTDGSLDSSFTLSVSGAVTDIAQDSTGKIYIAGHFQSVAGHTTYGIARLNSDGSYDSTFTLSAGNYQGVQKLAITSDGKIYAIGYFTTLGGTSYPNAFARLNSDGTLDTGYGTVGPGMNGGNITSFTQMSDGKIYVTGSFTVSGPYSNLVRLNSDGTIDNTFTALTFNSNVNYIKEISGKFYVGGNFTSVSGNSYSRLARLNADGTLDTNFTSLTIDDAVDAIEKDVNGKIYIGGPFRKVNGANHFQLARLNSDGTLDSTIVNYNLDQGDTNSGIRTINSVSDGIYVMGDFTKVNANVYGRFGLLNSNGTLNTSLTDLNVSGEVYSIVKTSGGKYFITGNFSLVNGLAYYGLARLNPDFTLDTTFTDLNNSWHLRTSLKTLDNKVYCTGTYTYNNGNIYTLQRLNSDDSLDTGYTSVVFDNEIYSMLQASDGKIYVTGNFTKANGLTYNQVCRLNSDGSLDTTFTDLGIPASGGGQAISSYGGVTSIVQVANGKFYIGGYFLSAGASTTPYIARLNSNGTMDTTFAAAIANPVNTLTYDGTRVYVVNNVKLNRLNSDGTLDTTFEYTTNGNTISLVYIHTDGKIYVDSYIP